MNKKLFISVILFTLIFAPGIIARQEGQKESDKIPNEYQFIITGTLVYKRDGSPVKKRTVYLSEIVEKEGNILARMKIEDGIVMNPSSNTDSLGSFKIIADRRLLEKPKRFTLETAVMSRMTVLCDSNGIPLEIEVDEETNKFDFGKILIEGLY